MSSAGFRDTGPSSVLVSCVKQRFNPWHLVQSSMTSNTKGSALKDQLREWRKMLGEKGRHSAQASKEAVLAASEFTQVHNDGRASTRLRDMAITRIINSFTFNPSNTVNIIALHQR